MSAQEVTQDQGFLTFLNSLPQKTSTTVRFFERSDYFTVHGPDALFVAKEVFKTMSVVKIIGTGSQKTESVCLSRLNFESLIRDLLLVRQYRIEIYQSKGSGKAQDWSLEYKASPGNLTQLEDVLFGGNTALVESKGVIAIKIKSGNKEQIVGIAFGDPVLREFVLSEFNDNSFYSELEAVLVQLGPKECLLCPAGGNSFDEVKDIIKRNNILLSECKAGDFNSADIMQDLNRLLKSDSGSKVQCSSMPEADSKIAIQCVAALIRYFELLSDEANFGQFVLSSFHPEQYMRLDISAIRALGILPVSPDDEKSHSLLGLMNKCRTPQGQRLLTHWIKQPLIDVKKIEERLDIVESLIKDTELRQSLHENYLRRIPDLQMLAKKFQRKKCDLQDVYKVYTVANQLPNLLQCLLKHDGPHLNALKATFCTDLKERISEFDKYQDMVKSVVDLEAVESGEFIIKSECDNKLQELRGLMKKSQALIEKEIYKVAEDLGLEANKTVKLENCRLIGFYFRVTRKEEKSLRGKKSYTTIDTKQNGVRFYNPALKDLNEKYQSLRKSYEKYQEELVREVIDIAATYCAPMKLLGETVAHLDVLVSFACSAFNAPKPYVRPILSEKGTQGIILKQARHPCLEVQPNTDFIPNSIEMKKGEHKFHIITGPNMGGKSTFIRSIALNVLMAQIGSFVACDYAEISIVDAILTRVGAGDRPLKGVSTFMAEMLEVKHILKTATANSLIIVDELGRGTSTYDGFGLAWAISEYIALKIQSYCLFTTHFHELAALSEDISSVDNLHVTAVTSENDITFLYKVKPGVCDQSFGIHVAEMANFNKNVIEFAKQKIKELEEFEKSKIIDCNEKHGEDGAPLQKRMKSDFENAEQICESFLKAVASIDVEKDEAANSLQKIKKQMHESENSFMQKLLKFCALSKS